MLGDEALLQRILSNLLDNAFKFTETGSVSLSIRVLEKADPEAYPEKYCTVRFSVSDTGCGIAAGFLDEAFSTFSQQDPTFMREYSGAGLGLPIVKHLVNLMGGKIEIHSESGKGTRVEVLLPFDSAPAQSAESSKVSPPVPVERNAGLRVLVAEDSETNAAILRRYLRKLGCQVTVVKNGREAVESAGKYPYDFVLLDVHMPIMDGLQAAEKIKHGLGHSKPTIIAITADVFTQGLTELNEIGIDDVLIKPLTLEQLRAVVRI